MGERDTAHHAQILHSRCYGTSGVRKQDSYKEMVKEVSGSNRDTSTVGEVGREPSETTSAAMGMDCSGVSPAQRILAMVAHALPQDVATASA